VCGAIVSVSFASEFVADAALTVARYEHRKGREPKVSAAGRRRCGSYDFGLKRIVGDAADAFDADGTHAALRPDRR
jgi:hypothetical protein